MKDPYVLEDGKTLKNLLGITDSEKLQQAETDIGYVKLINADNQIQNKCDINLVKNIHKHIFGDIYEWAGEFRKTPLYKEEKIIPGISLEYARPENIEKELKNNLKEMNSYQWKDKGIDEITEQFTKCLAKIWRVHPFRDGNTITTLTFASIFARQNGFEMDMGTILDNLSRIEDSKTGKVLRWSVRDKFVLAALDEKDYPEPEGLEKVIKASIEKGVNKKIEQLNKIIGEER